MGIDRILYGVILACVGSIVLVVMLLILVRIVDMARPTLCSESFLTMENKWCQEWLPEAKADDL